MASANYELAYRQFLEKAFDSHNKDIEATIVWMFRNPNNIPLSVKRAKRELDQRERNEIIRDVLYPF